MGGLADQNCSTLVGRRIQMAVATATRTLHVDINLGLGVAVEVRHLGSDHLTIDGLVDRPERALAIAGRDRQRLLRPCARWPSH